MECTNWQEKRFNKISISSIIFGLKKKIKWSQFNTQDQTSQSGLSDLDYHSSNSKQQL